jgi:hypothetical protein
MWHIMNHYIATSAALFQDAVLFCIILHCISATLRLTVTYGKRFGLLTWSVRSPGLTLSDCCMWGHVKDRLLTSTSWRRTNATNRGVR